MTAKTKEPPGGVKEKLENFLEKLQRSLIPAINTNLFEINAKLEGFKQVDGSDDFILEEVGYTGHPSFGVVSVAVFLLEQQARMEQFFGDWEDFDDCDSSFRPRESKIEQNALEKVAEWDYGVLFYQKAMEVLDLTEEDSDRFCIFNLWQDRDKKTPIHEIVTEMMRCRKPSPSE